MPNYTLPQRLVKIQTDIATYTFTVESFPASLTQTLECVVIHINTCSFIQTGIRGTHILN